jgi:hypothetical protein
MPLFALMLNATLTLYINQDAMAMDLAHGHGSPANCHHYCHLTLTQMKMLVPKTLQIQRPRGQFSILRYPRTSRTEKQELITGTKS